MQRVNLVDMYSTPDFYKPPAADQLTNNTQYPNLNSLEYQKRTAPVTGPTSVRRNFFDFLRVNGLGNAVLVANRYTDRKWHGHFWGFECLEDVRGVETSPAASDKVSYELCCKDTVTGVRFIDDNMLLLADTAGTLALWSTKSAVRSPRGYCLFNVGQQSEHTGAIVALDLFATKRTNAVTGSSDGCIKCWDMGDGDLYSTQTYRAGHSRTITAVATAPTESDVFASVSLDRSIMVWDRRQSRPIVAVNNNSFNTGITAMVWSDSGRLYTGDEAGRVHSLDARQLGSIERSWCPFVGCGADGGRVHRLKLDGVQQRLAVVADSTVVKVLDFSEKRVAADVDNENAIVFKTPNSADFVRDVYWGEDGEHLYTIGWGAALTRLDMVAKSV